MAPACAAEAQLHRHFPRLTAHPGRWRRNRPSAIASPRPVLVTAEIAALPPSFPIATAKPGAPTITRPTVCAGVRRTFLWLKAWRPIAMRCAKRRASTLDLLLLGCAIVWHEFPWRYAPTGFREAFHASSPTPPHGAKRAAPREPARPLPRSDRRGDPKSNVGNRRFHVKPQFPQNARPSRLASPLTAIHRPLGWAA